LFSVFVHNKNHVFLKILILRVEIIETGQCPVNFPFE